MPPIKIRHPVFPNPPRSVDFVLLWAETLTRELSSFFSAFVEVIAPRSIPGTVSRQSCGTTFIIEPNATFIELYASGAVTSHATTAIALGYEGQWVVIHNKSGQSITIKNAALTQLNGAVDFVMSDKDILTLRWDSVNWVEMSRSVN